MRRVDASFIRNYYGHRCHCLFLTTRSHSAQPTTTTCTRFFSQANKKQPKNTTTKSRSFLLLYDSFLQNVAPTAWRSIGTYDLWLEHHPPMDDLFRSVMKEYADGVSREIEFRKATMMKSVSSSSTSSKWNGSILLRGYETHRSTSSGIIPISLWGYFFTNPTTVAPDRMELFQDGNFRRFLRMASLIAGVDNDIVKQHHHHKHDSWDYITIWNRFGDTAKGNNDDENNNTSIENAVEQACQRHHELVQEWKILGEQLRAKYAGDMQPWINPICPALWKGFVAWQSLRVQRYNQKTMEKTLPESDDTSSIQSSWQRLFGNDHSFQKYIHDIPETQKQLLEEIRADTLRWARACGVVGEEDDDDDEPTTTICSKAKLAAIDPALLTILVFHYHRGESDRKALQTFSRFFMFLVIYDDVMEHPECHTTAKEILLDLLYPE